MQIEWNDSYSVGDKKLDEQHKRWIKFYNQLDEAIREKSPQEFQKAKEEILKEMIEYVDYHFKYEEEVMRNLHYAEVNKHWRIHKNFRDKIYRLYRDHLDGELVLNREMMDMMKEWIVDHILKEDRKIVASFPQKHTKNQAI